jgi:hypothetical protein
MEKPIFTHKPSIINALFPVYAKNFFITLLPLIAIYIGTSYFLEIPFKILIFILTLIIIPIIPLTFKIIRITNTEYIFYKNHLIKEYEFLSITKQTIPYKHITNISIIISFWDRLSNAGDIVLHTAENETPDLVLQYVKNPKKLEKQILEITHKTDKRT